MATKRQIISRQKAKYQKSSKKDKSKILAALAETTGLTRGHLSRVLSQQYEYKDRRIKSGRGRKPIYRIAALSLQIPEIHAISTVFKVRERCIKFSATATMSFRL